jgi:hypothetical protein
MELELHGGFYFEKTKFVFVSSKKIRTKPVQEENICSVFCALSGIG